MTNLFVMLFSFEGRLNRARYWVAMLGILAVIAAVALIVRGGAWLAGWSVHPTLGALLFFILAIPYIIATFAILIKRLHDLNLSGWWILAIWLLAAFAGLGWDLIKADFTDAFGYSWRVAAEKRFPDAMMFLAVFLLGAIRGTRGPNRFGPEPGMAMPPA